MCIFLSFQLVASPFLLLSSPLQAAEESSQTQGQEERSELNAKLIQSVRDKNVKSVQELLAAGASPDAVAPLGSALMIAAWNGSIEILEALVDAGANVNAKHPLLQMTALMEAVNVPESVAFLIKKGADVNASSSVGKTALMEAAIYNKIESARLLVQAGADINATNSRGKTAYDLAVENGSVELYHFLGSLK